MILLIFIATLVVMVTLAANVFLVSIVKLHARSKTSLKDYANSANTQRQSSMPPPAATATPNRVGAATHTAKNSPTIP